MSNRRIILINAASSGSYLFLLSTVWPGSISCSVELVKIVTLFSPLVFIMNVVSMVEVFIVKLSAGYKVIIAVFNMIGLIVSSIMSWGLFLLWNIGPIKH